MNGPQQEFVSPSFFVLRMLACYRSTDRRTLKKICVAFLRNYARGANNNEPFLRKALSLPVDLQKAVFENVLDYVK